MANSEFITQFKQKVKNEIINDPLMVHAFGSPNYDPEDLDFSGEDVGDNHIFTWNRNPDVVTESITFMTILVNTAVKRYDNKWMIPKLEIWLYTHDEHMKLDPKDFPGIAANRNDYLSQLIDLKFNGRNILGGETDKDKIRLVDDLLLTTNTEGVTIGNFAYRHMIFETKDMNSSMCSRW